MPAEGELTESVQVKTRVPKYQRNEWKAAADRLGMSQSEFVRTMVQAGRSGFEDTGFSGSTSNPEEDAPEGSHPRGNSLESRVETTLAATEVMSWDQLVEELAGDFEDRLENALDDLQSANRVQYSGRDGGYVLIDDGE